MAKPAGLILERFLGKFKVNLRTGCWEWTSSKAGAGYGILFTDKVKGKTRFVYAHRFAYKYFVGRIPKEKEIDHICEIKCCVNPAHLRAVTHQENMLLSDTLASRNASRTHCKQGHPYNKENTHINPSGHRQCKLCWAFYRKRYKHK